MPTVSGFDQPAASGFGQSQRPQRHPAKDLLGAVVTLAVIGAFLVPLTDVLARRCDAGLKSRTGTGHCSGAAAFAHHAQPVVTLSVAAIAALAVIVFIWYLLWGYKTNGQARGTGPTVGS